VIGHKDKEVHRQYCFTSSQKNQTTKILLNQKEKAAATIIA